VTDADDLNARRAKLAESVREGQERAANDRGNGVVRVGGFLNGPQYARGYARAARVLFEHGEATGDLAGIAMPCVFLIRHTVELTLKDIVEMIVAVQRDEISLAEAERQIAPPLKLPAKYDRLTGTHSLKELFEILVDAMTITNRGTVPASWSALATKIEDELKDKDGQRWRFAEIKLGRGKQAPSFTGSEPLPLRDLLGAMSHFLDEATADWPGGEAKMSLAYELYCDGQALSQRLYELGAI
jgi:hypothetical protein